jgi:hypothetical protein
MREQRILHVDGLVAHFGLVAQRDVNRQQVVAPADLYAVAGVVENRRDLIVVHLTREFPQHALEVAGSEIEVLAHFEAEGTQGLRDQASVVLGIVQRNFRISSVADHECDAALPGGFDFGLRLSVANPAPQHRHDGKAGEQTTATHPGKEGAAGRWDAADRRG